MKAIGWVFVAAFASSGALGRDLSPASFLCPKYSGSMAISTFARLEGGSHTLLQRRLGVDYPDALPRVAYSKMDAGESLKDCSNKEYFCSLETANAGEVGLNDFVYAVPRRIDGPGKFNFAGREFVVSLYHGWTPRGDGLAKIWSTNSHGEKYQYLVKGGRGIVHLHYGVIRGIDRDSKQVVAYPDVECFSEGAAGLFPKVKIFGDRTDVLP